MQSDQVQQIIDVDLTLLIKSFVQSFEFSFTVPCVLSMIWLVVWSNAKRKRDLQDPLEPAKDDNWGPTAKP